MEFFFNQQFNFVKRLIEQKTDFGEIFKQKNSTEKNMIFLPVESYVVRQIIFSSPEPEAAVEVQYYVLVLWILNRHRQLLVRHPSSAQNFAMALVEADFFLRPLHHIYLCAGIV